MDETEVKKPCQQCNVLKPPKQTETRQPTEIEQGINYLYLLRICSLYAGLTCCHYLLFFPLLLYKVFMFII